MMKFGVLKRQFQEWFSYLQFKLPVKYLLPTVTARNVFFTYHKWINREFYSFKILAVLIF